MSSINRLVIDTFTARLMESRRGAARILGVSEREVYRWLHGEHHPTRTWLTRMCRLVLWGARDWPSGVRVHWDEMRVSHPDLVGDPFRLGRSSNIRFGYGGERDGGALIRDAMEWLGLEHKTHLGRLLGLPEKERYRYIWAWSRGDRKAQGRYVIRLLALLIWQWRGYPVGDMWAVHWEAKQVEWAWEGKSLAPLGIPGCPFIWMEQQWQERRRPLKTWPPDVFVEPRPVSMYRYEPEPANA